MPAKTIEKTVTVAHWEYRNPDGKRRRAYFGDVVTLTAEEVERGERAGVFDQPPAGPVNRPPFSAPVFAEQFAAALRGIEPRTPEPAGDGEVAALHHDLQPPTDADQPAEPIEDDEPTAVVNPTSAGDESDDDVGAPHSDDGKPLRAATKPVLIEWLSDHQSAYSSEELEAMNKEDLWALIDSASSKASS